MPAKSSIDGMVAAAAAAAISLGPVPHAVPAGGALGAGAAPPHVLPAGSAPEGLAAAAEAVNLCFQGNFPQHAWRTRFQAFLFEQPHCTCDPARTHSCACRKGGRGPGPHVGTVLRGVPAGSAIPQGVRGHAAVLDIVPGGLLPPVAAPAG